jgi:glutathione synthase/RimK-type ligase-like ATP-grasp enzyme
MLDGLTLTRPRTAQPPLIHGTACLAMLASKGWTLPQLLTAIGPTPRDAEDRAAWLLDRSLAHALTFHPEEAAALQAEALAIARVFRLHGAGGGARLLALMAPGNLMVNAPLDFLTQATSLQLDLAFTTVDGTLPAALPEHDVAIVAASESAPAALAGLAPQLAGWGRPVLNNPAAVGLLSRDWLAQALAGAPGITVAPAVRVTRAALRRQGVDMLLPGGRFPVLLRPLHSHGGEGLSKLDSVDDLALFLLMTDGDAFYLTQYIDYRGAEGWFRKSRIAFVDRVPHLCHMAASEHWMVHYVNAGMAESAAKRDAEAAAMAGFDTDFAVRHRVALAAICDAIGLEYFSIDCGEAPDGTLLVFEADVAAIIHSMDDPAVYPYKAAPMQRCYNAFAAMIERRAHPG